MLHNDRKTLLFRFLYCPLLLGAIFLIFLLSVHHCECFLVYALINVFASNYSAFSVTSSSCYVGKSLMGLFILFLALVFSISSCGLSTFDYIFIYVSCVNCLLLLVNE